MSENITSLASENLNPSLRSLLEDVQKGLIRVPKFQRPFIWSDLQRIELLRSIRDNMPIGSLLIWRTTEHHLSSFEYIGPHAIPKSSDVTPSLGWQFLLDGHQRVSTLLGLLMSPDMDTCNIDDEDQIDWNIVYDLEEQDFIFEKKIKRKSKGSYTPILPLSTLLDGRLVNKHLRGIRNEMPNTPENDQNLELWEERADNISYRFQQCRIPVVIMVSDDLQLAAKTFQRINSLGTPMGEAHLVSALTWKENFDLREQISTLKRELPAGWRNIEESIYLQVCRGIIGLDITKSGQLELVHTLNSNPDILSTAGKAINTTINWFVSELLIHKEELLPYSLQLVIIASEIAKSNSSIKNSSARRWFWRTASTEVFTVGAYREVKREQDLLSNPDINNEPWDISVELPSRFDFRSARVRLHTLLLANYTAPRNSKNKRIDTNFLLNQYGRDSLVRYITNERGSSKTLKQLIQGPGNRFLLDPEDASEFFMALENGSLDTDTLESHFISEDSILYLKEGNYEGFLNSRADDISKFNFNISSIVSNEFKRYRCPSCGAASISAEDNEILFGYRIMSGVKRIQSYCRSCRSSSKKNNSEN
ncbi:DUF262 domain-containing protein [Aeromonas caviae]|uniref:DUF262 domain-containing protein n=1 Tax=Aeromonas caviae TaxID=648 RepID=UPI0038CF900F